MNFLNFHEYLKNTNATSYRCALGAGRVKPFFFTGFFLKGTGSYLVWSQCFPHVGTIYLISMTNWLNEVLYDGKAASKCLKSGSHLPKKYFICFNESPLKMMKNAFYFILKVFFVFKIFKFLSWLFSYIENIAWRKR